MSGLVYSVSKLFQDDEKRSERQIIEEYLNGYLASHPEAITRWGLDVQPAENGIPLTQMATQGNESPTEALHQQVSSA